MGGARRIRTGTAHLGPTCKQSHRKVHVRSGYLRWTTYVYAVIYLQYAIAYSLRVSLDGVRPRLGIGQGTSRIRLVLSDPIIYNTSDYKCFRLHP